MKPGGTNNVEVHPSIRVLAVCGDTHAGGSTALCPPGFELLNGSTTTLNREQAHLWEAWQEWQRFIKSCARGRPYALLVGGDTVEGVHHDTTELVSNNRGDHVNMARELLWPIASKAACVFMLRGTDSHVGPNGCDDEKVGQEIDAFRAVNGGAFSAKKFNLQFGRWRINATHHVGGSSSAYGGMTALSREIVKAWLDEARWQRPSSDIYLRFHTHRSDMAGRLCSRGMAQAMTIPAWQYPTGYVYKGGDPGAPHIGGLVLEWDEWGWYARWFTVPPLPERIFAVSPQSGRVKANVSKPKRTRRAVRRN